MAQREHDWELKEAAANAFALRVMRTYIPTDINMCTVPELMKRAADAGMLYTADFAQVRISHSLLVRYSLSSTPPFSTSKASGCYGGS